MEKTFMKYWCIPEKIEKWLEMMEAQGWNLQSIGFGGMRFRFAKGQARQVRYCADYQDKTTDEYRNIFGDAGWELVYSGSGWYIWRMPYEGERPEIYSDFESLIGRNKRMISVLIAAFIPFMSILVINMDRIDYTGPFGIGFICVYLVLIAFEAAMVARLAIENGKLKKNRK